MVPGARACLQRCGWQALLGLRGRRRRVARTLERVRPRRHRRPTPERPRASDSTPAHPTRPSLSLAGTTVAAAAGRRRRRSSNSSAWPRAILNRHAAAGFLSGFTTGGDRLFAPAPTCAGCQEADARPPGRLLQCARCARGWRAKCVGMPTVDVAAAQGGELVCGHCATCDGCGALAVSEIEGHWAPDAAHACRTGGTLPMGGKLLCVACHGGVRSGGCDAKTLERWGAGAHGAQCGACSLWCATPADAGAAAGKPMPPPPPASVGGGSFKPKKVDRCGRCDGELLYLELRDALDELQALDPLHVLLGACGRGGGADVRSIIPDPVDFQTNCA